MLISSLLLACGFGSPSDDEPSSVTAPEVSAETPSENNTAVPPVPVGDPMFPTASTASTASTAATTATATQHSDLSELSGTWIAIQPKANRQVVYSMCGTKAQTLIIGDKIIVETAFERAEQTVASTIKDDSGMITVTLAEDASSTLKLSETSGVLSAMGWSNDNTRYVRESSAQNLERIALFEAGCPTQANSSSSAYQALLGSWILGNEYKCATAIYTLAEGIITKGSTGYVIEDISNTEPLWVTVKDNEGTRSGIQLTSVSGKLTLIDGTGDWQPQRLKKRDCNRPTPSSGTKKTVPPGLRNRVPKARGR